MAAVRDSGFEQVDQSSPSIFSWFGTIWLFPVPHHEKKMAGKQYRTDVD